MATRNDITGDKIQTKTPSKAYKDNWDNIFGKKDKTELEADICEAKEGLDSVEDQFTHYTEERPPRDKKPLSDLSEYEYNKLKDIGFLFEFYPEATGIWKDDCGKTTDTGC